jgi:hypothetical protein
LWVHPEGKRKLKRLWAQLKMQRMYQFCDRLKLQNWFFGCHKTSNTQIGILCHCGSALTLPTCRYHKNKGSIMLLESCLQLTAKILVKSVIFAESLWQFVWIRPCCMQHICNVGWCQLLLPFIDGGPFCQFFTYQHLIQSSGRHCEASGWLFGEWWCHEKLCCAAGCSDLQNRSAVMDLMICDFQSWIPHSMMSSFVVTPRGFCSKAYCKGILPDSPYTILLLLPAISFWPKKGEHSMEWHMDRKDTWLALNQSKAKYLGQTMVPKGSTWALESPGWARAGVKKRNVTTGSSWSLSIRLLPSHPWQTMLSFTQLPSPPHLVAKASLRMANDALEWCKQWLTDWPSPSLVTHCLIWENPSGFTLHHLVAPAICFWAKERGAQHGMTHRQKGHVAKLK